MKKILLSLSILISGITTAQYVDKAGSAAASGAVHSYYHDQVDNLLYAIGPVSNAGGQTISGVMSWNGSDWTPKGDQTLLGGPLITGAYNSITRHKDTLYAMAAQINHSSGNPMSFLMYWDAAAGNWKNKSYGVFGNEYTLVSYSDTLFIVGNISGGLDLSEDISKYASLGKMAYWSGGKWNNYGTNPSFNGNPKGAVIVNGALYVENYKYQNGVWTDLGTMQTIHSIGKWGSKVVYSVETGVGNYSIMMYDGATLSTIGTTDAEVKSIAEFGDTLAVCGLGLKDVNGTTVNRVASYDGTTWRTVFPTYIQGTGAFRLGGFHNQLLVSAENGGWYDTSTGAVSIGSIVLVGGALTVDAKEIENTSVVAFPNPSNGVVSFTSVCDAISVYSATGQLLISKTNSQQVNLSGYASGVYSVKIQIDGNSKVINLIKK